jgi:uncharacterized membrane protein YfcA
MGMGAALPGGQTLGKSIAVGSLSGALNGFCGIGGPPAVLYFLGARGSSDRLRASFIVYFAVLYPVTVLTLVLGGLVGIRSALAALLLAPVYYGATEAGRWCFQTIHSRYFVPVCTAVLCLSGILMLLN